MSILWLAPLTNTQLKHPFECKCLYFQGELDRICAYSKMPGRKFWCIFCGYLFMGLCVHTCVPMFLNMFLHMYVYVSSDQSSCIVWVVSLRDYPVPISSALGSRLFTWVVRIQICVLILSWKHFDFVFSTAPWCR